MTRPSYLKDAQQLRNDRDALRDTIRSFDDEVTEKSEAFQQLSPTAKHSAVTALCRQHGVAILQDQSVEAINLPDLRNKSVETLQSLVSKEATSFRELTLACDYTPIVTLLKKFDLQTAGMPVTTSITSEEVLIALPTSCQQYSRV